jgi:peptidoglycan hydrolase-like protein with peptidoglycan-binding domain
VKKAAVDGFERKSVVSQVLQRGMTGGAVTGLQQKLVAARFMSNADFRSGPGVYGPRTEAAVKRLQQSVGLPVTGIAGPSTLAALSSGARYQPVETTFPVSLALVHARLSETFTDEVTQPMGIPL